MTSGDPISIPGQDPVQIPGQDPISIPGQDLPNPAPPDEAPQPDFLPEFARQPGTIAAG